MIGDPFWHRLISDPRLLDLAEVFIGSNLALFATHYIAKAPKTGRPVLWHQDGSYWPLRPMEVSTLWLACSASTPENGCMRVIPGTQNLDLQEMKPNTEIDSVLQSEIDASFVDDSGAVAVLANLTTATGKDTVILAGNPPTIAVRKTQLAPKPDGTTSAGRVFVSFSDPVCDNAGEITFAAKILDGKVPKSGLWSNAGGTLREIATVGGPVAEISGASRNDPRKGR
jgi:hypothetical protein